MKAAKGPPSCSGGGVNTGLTQQGKEFQAFIVWIVIGPGVTRPESGFAPHAVWGVRLFCLHRTGAEVEFVTPVTHGGSVKFLPAV